MLLEKIQEKKYHTRKNLGYIFVGLFFFFIIAGWLTYEKYLKSKTDYERIANNKIIINSQQKWRQIEKTKQEWTDFLKIFFN